MDRRKGETSMSTATLEPLAYSVKEAASALRVHPNTIRNLIRDGELVAARIRDRVIIRRESLKQLLLDGEKV
jgi:excisionase family DNA binding protein